MNFNGFSNKRIPQLASATQLQGGEYVVVYQDEALKKVTISQISAGTGSIEGSLPSGGITGQFLRKNANGNYEVEWSDVSSRDIKMDFTFVEDGTSATAAINQITFKKSPAESSFSFILPESPQTGDQVFIKDSNGDASNNKITIYREGVTVDGSDSIVIHRNYGSVNLIYNGSEWNAISGSGYGETGKLGKAVVGTSVAG